MYPVLGWELPFSGVVLPGCLISYIVVKSIFFLIEKQVPISLIACLVYWLNLFAPCRVVPWTGNMRNVLKNCFDNYRSSWYDWKLSLNARRIYTSDSSCCFWIDGWTDAGVLIVLGMLLPTFNCINGKGYEILPQGEHLVDLSTRICYSLGDI